MNRRQRFKKYFKDRPNLTKALIAGGFLAGGTALALKTRGGNKWLRRGGIATAAAGAGGAFGFGGEFARRQRQRANALGQKVVAAGSLGKDIALENVRHLPSEVLVHGLIDLPFSTAEGILARNIAARTGRISEYAGSRLHEIQRGATLATAPKVRGLQTKAFGKSDSAPAAHNDLLRVLDSMPKGLRTEADALSRQRALHELGKMAKAQGNAIFSISQMNEVLDKAGLPRTVDMRMWLNRAQQEQALFGRSL